MTAFAIWACMTAVVGWLAFFVCAEGAAQLRDDRNHWRHLAIRLMADLPEEP